MALGKAAVYDIGYANGGPNNKGAWAGLHDQGRPGQECRDDTPDIPVHIVLGSWLACTLRGSVHDIPIRANVSARF